MVQQQPMLTASLAAESKDACGHDQAQGPRMAWLMLLDKPRTIPCTVVKAYSLVLLAMQVPG